MRTLIMIYEKCKKSWRKWVSEWCQSAKISRLSGMNRYFIVIIYTYRIVRRRIRNGYHENTLQVKKYTLTQVSWVYLRDFPAEVSRTKFNWIRAPIGQFLKFALHARADVKNWPIGAQIQLNFALKTPAGKRLRW